MAKVKRQTNTRTKRAVKKTKKVPVKKRTSSTSSVVNRITSMEDIEESGFKVNIYGKSGTGKTSTWATFPKPILAIICSGGNRTGELKSIDTPEYRKVVSKIDLESTEDIAEIAQYCRDNTKEFKTVVLDHVTGFQDLCLKEILGLDEIPVQSSWGQASQREYGQLGVQMKERLRDLLDIPQHVIIVGQEREFNVDSDNQILTPYVGTAITPSVAAWLYTACDYICQTFIRSKVEHKTVKVRGKEKKITKQTGKVEYCLRIGPDPVYTTKFRIPKEKGGNNLPEVIVDPSFDKLKKFLS